MSKLISFLEFFFFKIAEDDGTGYIYKKYASFRYGLLLWNSKDKYVVIRYPVLITIPIVIILWILIEHVQNINERNWFTMIYGYLYPMGSLSYTLTFQFRVKTFIDLSRTLDKGWTYKYLEKKYEEIKRESEVKMDKFDFYYYNMMKISGLAYVGLHTLRSVFNSDTSLSRLLIFPCWSPYPLDAWWGFGLTFCMEMMIMVTLMMLAGRMVSFLYTAIRSLGTQYRMAGLSLLTVKGRVLREMARVVVSSDAEYAEVFCRLLVQEIRSTAVHLQVLNRSAEVTCQVFEGPINMYYYPGLLCLSLATVKLMSDREYKFEFLFTLVLATITIMNLYLICFLNQILQNEFEKLRFNVYDSDWFMMPAPIRKNLHIIQSMFIRTPNIRTLLGTNTDMDFFGKVFNAYYCFINAGRTLNINY